MIKIKVAGFYPANQGNLKSFQKALIGWKKAGPPKSHFCFNHVNRLNMPRFHVPFWLSYILVYLFYFCPSFCPN